MPSSSPRNSRLRFDAWRATTSTATAAITVTSPHGCPASATAMGNAMTTMIDASDALCVSRTMTNHTTAIASGEQRKDHEQHARAGRHATAALEMTGHRERVPDDRRDPEHVRADVAVGDERDRRPRRSHPSRRRARTRARPTANRGAGRCSTRPGSRTPPRVMSTPRRRATICRAREGSEQVRQVAPAGRRRRHHALGHILRHRRPPRTPRALPRAGMPGSAIGLAVQRTEC